MALSAHTFMPVNAFCLDVEKPSVDWHVLQMSVFFVNVLVIFVVSVQILYDHLKSGSPSLRNKLQRESVATVHIICSTDYSLFCFFSLSSSVCFEEAQTQSCMSKRNTSL